MAEYIGSTVSQLLESEPFKFWPVQETFEGDLDETIKSYIFEKHGLEVTCDRDDNVRVIFLYPEKYGGFDESLLEISFSLSRSQVFTHLGAPSKSKDGFIDSILGAYGGWDRFALADFTIHIQYEYGVDRINLITLMRNDAVPE